MKTDFSNSIAIVFPTDWPVEASEAHCTLLFLGKVSESTYTKEDVQSVLDRMQIRAPGSIETTEFELFGRDKNMLVLKLNPTKLLPIRDAIERALEKIGAENGSEFKDYKPHVTVAQDVDTDLEEAVKSVGAVPDLISLHSPILWWGTDR